MITCLRVGVGPPGMCGETSRSTGSTYTCYDNILSSLFQCLALRLGSYIAKNSKKNTLNNAQAHVCTNIYV